MTKDEIISMAKEAGFWQEHTNTWMCASQDIERFAALVAKKEREACAKVCEQEWNEYCDEPYGYALAVKECAAAIRSRSSEH